MTAKPKALDFTRLATFLSTLLLSCAAIADPTVYNLTADWSDTQNPNGPWSYNYNNAPIPVYQTFWWGQSGWGDNWIGDGAILKGTPPAGTDPWGGSVPPPHDWLPGDVMMHAVSIPYGGDSKFLNVTWTSPGDGTISISGRAWDGEIFSDRDMRWGLSVGGQLIAQRLSVIGLYRTDSGAQFANNLLPGYTLTSIPVTQGEVVDFVIATQTYYGHFMGVDETIAFTPVPEPGTAAMFAVALAGLVLLRRRSS